MSGRCLIAALSALAFAAAAGPAGAGSKTGQFAVRANVVNDCQVSTQDLQFGQYDYQANTRATTVFSIRCTPGATVSIALDGGGSGNPQQRHMAGPANLGYQLYKDSGYSQPIDTAGESFKLEGSANTGQEVPYTLYGEIPSGQAVPAGNYTDMVRVTVNF